MSQKREDYTTKAQTIFRIEKNKDNPYVMIDRRLIENPKLSWKAKGLLAYLLSRPDNWTVRFRDLVNRSPDGGHTIRAAMKELKDARHVKVRAERENGRIKQWVYTVYESPDGDFQQVEKQDVENRTLNDIKAFNDIKNGVPPISSMPLDWKLTHGENVTNEDLLAQEDAERKDSANLIATGFGIKARDAYALAYAFQVARGITIPTGRIKGQRKAVKEMLEMKVTAKAITEAVQKLIADGMTITDLFSISKTAMAIANPSPAEKKNVQIIGTS